MSFDESISQRNAELANLVNLYGTDNQLKNLNKNPTLNNINPKGMSIKRAGQKLNEPDYFLGTKKKLKSTNTLGSMGSRNVVNEETPIVTPILVVYNNNNQICGGDTQIHNQDYYI
jgi:hypothetical protein